MAKLVARCLEVDWGPGTWFAVRGIVETWEDVRADATTVELVEELPGWRVFTTVYRLESATGRRLYYLVAEE